MIIFDLLCDCGMQFEGWFNSHSDYKSQVADKALACPVCSGTDIHKILSPVALNIPKSLTQHNAQPAVYTPQDNCHDENKAIEFVKELKKFVDNNFENVGTDLAKEALKIHYGVEKARNIRGTASAQEEKMLKEEGVDLLKIPIPVDDEQQDS